MPQHNQPLTDPILDRLMQAILQVALMNSNNVSYFNIDRFYIFYFNPLISN